MSTHRPHIHIHEDGTVHEDHRHSAADLPDAEKPQVHEDGAVHHSHTHTHDPEEIKAIVNRLKRSVGHLDKVRRMVEAGEDCSDVLVQLSAVKSEINNTGKLILKQHMEHCIVEAVQEKDYDAIERMNRAIDRFMK